MTRSLRAPSGAFGWLLYAGMLPAPPLVVLSLLAGCAAPAVPPKAPPAPADRGAVLSTKAQRPPLASEEVATQRRLEQHLAHLSGKVGERHPGKPWELADAADYLAAELEGMGYGLERQGYETGDVAAQNLVVTAPGGAAGDQVILVAAHYDSPPGDAGGHAGGSGAVAVLELARAFAKSDLSRTVRFALFALGESPHGDGAARGARVYGESLAKRRAAAEAELQRDAEAKASGALPEALPAPAVDRSRVVAVILLDRLLRFDHELDGAGAQIVVRLSAGPGADAYLNALADNLGGAPLLVQRARLEAAGPESDASYWLSQDVPVVLVHGDRRAGSSSGPAAPATAPTPDAAHADDLDALTRIVFGVRAALRDAAAAQAAGGDPYLQ